MLDFFLYSHILFGLRHGIKKLYVSNVLLGCVGLFLWSALLTFFLN